MPFSDTKLQAMYGETIPVRFSVYDEDNDAVDISSGVTWAANLYDEEILLATYADGDFDATNAASGYVDLQVACIAPGVWKLQATATFSSGIVIKPLAFLEIDYEGPPTVTYEVDATLPDIQISATGSG